MNQRRSFLFFSVIVSSLCLSGCFSIAAIRSISVHEDLKPKSVFVRSDGAIVVPVSTTYWHESVFDKGAWLGEGSKVPLSTAARDRLLVMSPADVEKVIAELKSDPRRQTPPYKMDYLCIADKRGDAHAASVMPTRFWGPSLTIEDLKLQTEYAEYNFKEPVSYKLKQATVLLDFGNLHTFSDRQKNNWLRIPVVIPAMAADAGSGVALVAVAVISPPVNICYEIYKKIVGIGSGTKATPTSNPDEPVKKKKNPRTLNSKHSLYITES